MSEVGARTGWRALLAVAVTIALVAPSSAASRPVAYVTAPACPGAEQPPPPAAKEESASSPLPVPATPVGGPLLGGCGDVTPAGVAAPPQVGAAAWVLADLDSGAVLAARAPHARHRPASTLKVLTALVALDRLDPDTVVEGTAEDANIDGSRAGIGPGGRYTVRQLLAGLLLNSGNDTANALARALGGVPATLDGMNATAHRLGALDTRAATPSGLDGPGMSTSAYDLALLFRVALRDALFAETVGTRSVPFPGYGTQPGFTLSNVDKLLHRYPGTIGGKTGFTDAARHTYVAAAARDGRRLVVAVVRGEQRPVPMWQQAAALLDLGFRLPRGTPPVGTLVDAAPADSDLATPPGSGTPDGDGWSAAGAAAIAVAAGVGGVAAGAGGVALLRRTRPRRRA